MKFIVPLLLLCLTCGAQDRHRALLIARNNAIPSPPVAGFTLWLDASDPATMFTNGIGTVRTVAAPDGSLDQARVGKWVDKSAGGTNHVYEVGDIAAEDTRPYLTNGVFGIRPSLRFAQNVAGRSGLQASNNTVFGTAATSDSVSVFIVASLFTSPDTFDMLFTWESGAGTGFEMRKNNSATAVQFITPNFGAATGTIVANQGYVFSFLFNNAGDTATVFTNLAQAGTVGSMTDNNPGSAEFAIGRRVDATVGNFWHGFVSEVLLYPSLLTGNDLTNTITYLKNKHGL